MIELTPEQHAALERGDTLVRDAATNERFVLVRADLYDRLQSLLADDAAALVNEVMADDDANDPLLESYQHFAKEGS
jgi:hypothetical protein